MNMKATFYAVEVADDFDVVVMYDDSGLVIGSVTAA
jgi:hypothetical protein